MCRRALRGPKELSRRPSSMLSTRLREKIGERIVFSWAPSCLLLTRPVKLGSKRKLQGIIAKDFAPRVERHRGAESAASSSNKAQLVETKLEMVRAAWLLQHVDIICRFCWLSRVDRFQRGKID